MWDIDLQPNILPSNDSVLLPQVSKGLTVARSVPVLKSLDYIPSGGLSNNTNKSLYFYENATVDDDWEVYSNLRISEYMNPVRISPNVLNQHYQSTQHQNCLVLLKFYDSNSSIVEKPEENTDFVVVKQKRYKRKQGIGTYWVDTPSAISEGVVIKKIPNQNTTSRFLQNNLILQQITATGGARGFDFYSSMKLNRNRSEMFSVNLARRLLRTTRTLVLPAYTNISIIANSYDVVHS